MGSRFARVCAVSLTLSGCASWQLNQNTLDLASTTGDLLTKQVLHNLEQFIDSDTAIPAQVVISSGAASTTNSLAPSISGPFDLAVQKTIAAVTSFQITRPITSGGLNASDTWSQNWGFAPVTDPFQMRRLTALYRFGIDGDARAFVSRFPLLQKSVSITHSECLHSAGGKTVRVNIDQPVSGAEATAQTPTVSLCATSTSGGGVGGLQVAATTVGESRFVPDEYALSGPACIVCRRGKHLVKNERLQAGWLRWINLPGAGNLIERPPLPGDRPLGIYGHHELFAAQGEGDKYVEFTLFVLAASTAQDAVSTQFSSQSGNGRSGSRPGTQSLITPQGDVIPVVPSN